MNAILDMLNWSSPYFKMLLLIVALILFVVTSKKLINGYVKKYNIEPNRKKFLFNLLHLISYTVGIVLSLLFFGVELREVMLFASSILAVLGIGFFAQWSILSNLTASVILFFYHPMRIGDTIKIIDKEYDFKGQVKDITAFYVHIYIEEENRNLTIPNNVILYKGIEIVS